MHIIRGSAMNLSNLMILLLLAIVEIDVHEVRH